MCYFNIEHFALFMLSKNGIEVDEEKVGEESVMLYKEELDNNLVSETLLEVATEMVLLHTCVYDIEENEWVVCVASDADTNYPLFLICMKDNVKIYEEILVENY